MSLWLRWIQPFCKHTGFGWLKINCVGALFHQDEAKGSSWCLLYVFDPSRWWMNWKTGWLKAAWLSTITAVTSSQNGGSILCLCCVQITLSSTHGWKIGNSKKMHYLIHLMRQKACSPAALVPVAETWLEAVMCWGELHQIKTNWRIKKVVPHSTLGIWQAMIKGCHNTTTQYKLIYQSHTKSRACNCVNSLFLLDSFQSAYLKFHFTFKSLIRILTTRQQWTRGEIHY